MAAAGQEDEDATLAAQLASQGALVRPRDDCPHLGDNVSGDVSSVFEKLRKACHQRDHEGKGAVSCEDCESQEIWICLKCGAIKCSRYANRHMLEHERQNTHCVAASYVDLSLWCFQCEDYLDFFSIPVLHEPVRQLHQLKFNEEASLPTITLDTGE
eukprot:gb/GECG01003291.1/.p1 GENE.gb/GECG01003291.1/~~gb/GECG01003291.1/.p1  ORF type:complete len:157 (+),score=17.81 gb/GECG01003291.1/:1-471(+)